MTTDRSHHFGSCTIAYTLRVHISESTEEMCVNRENIWLAIPPHNDIEQSIWDVVCLAAISAMDYGRRTLYASREEDGIVNVATLTRIRTQVIADFWGRLQSFVHLGRKMKGWDRVRLDHPWIARNTDGGMWLNKPTYIILQTRGN